jgi:hypothetical protein
VKAAGQGAPAPRDHFAVAGAPTIRYHRAGKRGLDLEGILDLVGRMK